MVLLQFFRHFREAFAPSVPHPDFPGVEIRIPSDVFWRNNDQLVEIDTGLTIRIPPGYIGRLGPSPSSKHGLAVMVQHYHCQQNHRVVLQVKTRNEWGELKRGDVVAVLQLRKAVYGVNLLERPSADTMLNINPAPVVQFCRTVPEAFMPEVADDGYYIKSLYHYEIHRNHQVIVSTGLCFKFPEGYYGVLEPTDAQIWLKNLKIVTPYVSPNSRCELRFILKHDYGENRDYPQDVISIDPGDNVAVLHVRKMQNSRLVEVTSQELGLTVDIEPLAEERPRSPPPPLPASPPLPRRSPRGKPSSSTEEESDEGPCPDKGWKHVKRAQRRASSSTGSPSPPPPAAEMAKEEFPTAREPKRRRAVSHFSPRVRGALTVQLTLVFHHAIPHPEQFDRLVVRLETAFRRLGSACTASEHTADDVYYASCVKQVLGRVLTLLVSFAGPGVSERDYRTVELALEEAVQEVSRTESLSLVYKVCRVTNELQHFF